jgi:uncharacterized protein
MDRLPEDREVEVLDEAECLRLLTTAAIGRVAFTEGALPAVQPVSFLLGDAEVYIPTPPGSKLAAASRGAVVAFAVDDVDAHGRTGWNVTVVGPSRVIVDAVEVRRLDDAGVRPWAPGGDHCYIGIAVRMVQGRRISRPGAADGLPVPSEDVPRTALPA